MIGFAVVIGYFVSKPASVSPLQLALGFLTGFLVCAYSMAVNDAYDVEVDRVNRPERPIPSGRLTIGGAHRLAAGLLLAGVACSVLSLDPWAVAIALVYALLSWFYNSSAKKTGLPGNAIVASSLAIPFIYGGVVSGGSLTGSLLIMMALTSFFAGVGREVVKGMADVKGDPKRGVRTVAMSMGPRGAAAVGGGFFAAAIVTSWVPLLTGLANQVYTLGVVVPDAIFAYLAASILLDSTPTNAYRVKKVALAGMTVGLLVFIGGAY